MATLSFAAPAADLQTPFRVPLRAGPVELDFVDGDLRHVRAGGEELLRRITFNVRHHRWDTAEWHLDSFRLTQQPDSFFLHFSAVCEIAGAGYRWEGDLTGESDGTLTYGVLGIALADTSEVRRAGLNILYANEAVLGQPFQTTHLDGKVISQTFPERVPAHHLPAMDFSKISHRTRGGALVTAKISGSHFGLEDQRVAGDSSFKAFSGLRHTYAPVLTKGDRAEASLTLTLTDFTPNAPAPKSTTVQISPEAVGHLPELSPARPQETYGVFHELTRRPAAKNGIFLDLNLAPGKSHGASALTWGWYPTINLYDDEAVMENAASISEQLLSARRFAPQARLRIDPIALDSIHPRARPRDPRNDTPFAAAWLVAATKHLTLGGAHEAAFALDGPFAKAALAALQTHAGEPVRYTAISVADGIRLESFALETPNGLSVWVANLTDETQALTVQGLPPLSGCSRHRLHAGTGPVFRDFPAGFTDLDGRIALRVAPYEVCAMDF